MCVCWGGGGVPITVELTLLAEVTVFAARAVNVLLVYVRTYHQPESLIEIQRVVKSTELHA